MKLMQSTFIKLRTTTAVFHQSFVGFHPRTLSTKQIPKVKHHDYVLGEDEIRDANEQYKNKIEIQERDRFGRGLFAQTSFQEGDLVMSSRAVKITETKDSHTLQNNWKSHIVMDLPAIMINHKCEANVGLKDNVRTGSYDFFALTDIEKDEELYLDYETAEYEIDGFQCSCGSDLCRHTLKGFKYHGGVVKQQYGEEFISSYLLHK